MVVPEEEREGRVRLTEHAQIRRRKRRLGRNITYTLRLAAALSRRTRPRAELIRSIGTPRIRLDEALPDWGVGRVLYFACGRGSIRWVLGRRQLLRGCFRGGGLSGGLGGVVAVGRRETRREWNACNEYKYALKEEKGQHLREAVLYRLALRASA